MAVINGEGEHGLQSDEGRRREGLVFLRNARAPCPCKINHGVGDPVLSSAASASASAEL
jgi:hypothetical protein